MTVKKTEPKTQEYIFRITKTTNLSPFLKLSYRKNKDTKYIQFRDCIYVTSSLSDKTILMKWIDRADIELADESENRDLVIRKGKETTAKYYGEKTQEEDNELSENDILEG